MTVKQLWNYPTKLGTLILAFVVFGSFSAYAQIIYNRQAERIAANEGKIANNAYSSALSDFNSCLIRVQNRELFIAKAERDYDFEEKAAEAITSDPIELALLLTEINVLRAEFIADYPSFDITDCVEPIKPEELNE